MNCQRADVACRVVRSQLLLRVYRLNIGQLAVMVMAELRRVSGFTLPRVCLELARRDGFVVVRFQTSPDSVRFLGKQDRSWFVGRNSVSVACALNWLDRDVSLFRKGLRLDERSAFSP